MFINDVRLVGRLMSSPEFKTSGQGKKYAILKVQTGRQFKGGRWVFQEHRVICFKEAAFAALEKQGERGTWVTVKGELTYMSGGNSAQVTVFDDTGDVHFMFADVWSKDIEMTDEEFALIKAADAHPIDHQNQQADNSSGSSEGEDVDDIPF